MDEVFHLKAPFEPTGDQPQAIEALMQGIHEGDDAQTLLGVTGSGKTFTMANIIARCNRPTLILEPNKTLASQICTEMRGFFPDDAVEYFVSYYDYYQPEAYIPSTDTYIEKDSAINDEIDRLRHSATAALSERRNVIIVASVSCIYSLGDPIDYRSMVISLRPGMQMERDELCSRLVKLQYERNDMNFIRNKFRVKGDTVDIHLAYNDEFAIRVEFFGDEIDRIRRMVSSTGQTIGNEDGIEIFPCRELALTDDAVHNMHVALYRASQDDSKLAALLEMVDARIVTPELDRFLPVMYGQTVSPLSHVSGKALVVLSEPRSLFDDCLRAYEDIEARAGEAGVDRLDGLYVRAQQLDFGSQQRLNYVSLIRAGGAVTAELKIEQPAIAGSDNRFMTRIQEVVGKRYACVFAIPDRGARESMELTFGDEGITFEESLTAAPENAGAIGDRVRVAAADSADRAARQEAYASICERRADALNARSLEAGAAQAAAGAAVPTISRGRVTFVDAALPQGVVVPDANLAVFSIADLNARMDANRARSRRKVDITQITFPFKPGDYVVHATHGIALFSEIARQEVGGKERDYFLLEYADGDKLYVPLEQVDRITRYVGPDGDKPRLTRLNTADWTRATNKARKNAKKLAFDLVDLYTRRSSITGIACPPDTPEQIEMEESFPYDETRDQLEAIADIKADMEAPKPMDRLLCGDVGYGKTEVALRAAFKAVVEGKQVAILAPTTILVQQHYNTIKKRFAGFPVKFDMLSRFRTPKEQREIVRKLREGELDLVVGTHRLLNKDVQFKDLGLLIVDEEHRFGVSHKESIQHMKTRVDVLTLSATPIPRTLHMSMAGIRDMSILETPPEERLPVKTYVMEYDDNVIREAIRRELARGGQVYFLYNRVRSIEKMYDRLHQLVPEARIGIAHGQMRENALEDVMLDFYAGAYDVLLCTTIVESGLDVPEANTLIVFDADRFGLSQLYQIRGRVGRSSRQAYAYLTVRANKLLSETADQRLSAIREFTEFGAGYRIAMRDLEIRGAGDVLGPQQSGHMSTVGYDMYLKLIEQAVSEAQGVEVTPELDTRVELAVDAFLPESYVPEEKLRVEIYKRIAMIQDEAGRMDIEEELIDRFGDVPEPVENLMRIAQLRGVTRRLGVSHLFLRPDGIHMRIDTRFLPDPGRLFDAVSRGDERLRFSAGRTAELVLAERGLDAPAALKLAIPVMTRVHDLMQENASAPV